MPRALKRMIALLLAVGMTAGGATFSYAQMHVSADVAAHDVHAVMHYADLAVDPGEDDCLHAAPSSSHHHDDGLCGKCCAACIGAGLVPTIPANVWSPSVARGAFLTRHDTLTAYLAPTEPDIPKPL